MQGWLSAAYLTDGTTGWFASAPSHFYSNPSLVSTGAVVEMSRIAGRPVTRRVSIVQWITSLENDAGWYVDPEWPGGDAAGQRAAIKALMFLGSSPSPQAVEAIAATASADGLFDPSGVGGEGAIWSTLILVEALVAIGTEPALDLAYSTKNGLVGVLGRSEASPLDGPSLAAAHALLMIGEAELPPEWRRAFVAGMSAVDDGTTEMPLRNLQLALEVREAVASGPHEASRRVALKTVTEAFGRYEGDLFLPSSYDLYEAVSALALIDTYNLHEIDQEDLWEHLDRIRNDRGWIVQPVSPPYADATFSGVTIGEKLRISAHDVPSVMAWVDKTIADLPQNSHELQLAAKTARALGFPLGPEASQAVLEELVHRIRVAEGGSRWGHMRALAALQASEDWQIPGDVREEMAEEVVSRSSRGQPVQWWLPLQLASGIEAVPVEDAVEAIMSTYDGAGGFRVSADLPVSSLMWTADSVSLLARLGRLDSVDGDAVLRFVESCRGPYGFAETAAGAESGQPTNLWTTRLALETISIFADVQGALPEWRLFAPEVSVGR